MGQNSQHIPLPQDVGYLTRRNSTVYAFFILEVSKQRNALE